MLFRWHHARLRRSAVRVGLALCYHAASTAPGDPKRELSAPIAVDAFERQVEHLRRNYTVVAASELADAVVARNRGDPLPVALTFDDDLLSHVEFVAPVLERAGVSATFFLTGAGIDGDDGFWWQTLQSAWDRDLVDVDLMQAWGVAARRPAIRDVARRLQGMSPSARDRAAASLRSRLGDESHQPPLDGDQIASLAHAGFEIGFHTLRHDDLVNLDDTDLADAMRRGRDALERAAGRPLTVIAYPHGRADARVAAAARRAGFRHGFVADGSRVDPASDPLLLGRRYPAPGSTATFASDLVRTLRYSAAAV
jgi:peptidoglycan/xylan/chitin deacetylase (PgdA/CDA1 family)